MNTKFSNKLFIVVAVFIWLMTPSFSFCGNGNILIQSGTLLNGNFQPRQLSVYDNPNEFHVGFNYTYNSTWIVNQNTYGQFGGKELAYKKTFGSSYGISLGYDFKRKIGFQTGYIINSGEGQKYSDVLGGIQFDRHVSFTYSHIPLLLKLRGTLSDAENPIILSFSMGAQYNMLKTATDVVNGISTDIKSRINKSDIGAVMNIEGDFYLCSFLYLTFGLNSSISNDINASGWKVNDDYGKSHNLLVGINLGLSYCINNK